MAITFVASSVFESASTSTVLVTITRPAGVQAGDLILVALHGATSSAPAAPTGWTEWEPNVTYGPSFTTFSRWAAADDPASWDFTVASQKWSASCTAWRGVDQTTPKDVASATASLQTGFPTMPTVTTVTAGAVVVALAATIGPSGDLDIDWTTTGGTERVTATSQASGTTNAAGIHASELRVEPSTSTVTVAPVETVGRGSIVLSALRPTVQATETLSFAGANATGWTATGGTALATLSDVDEGTYVTSQVNPSAQALDLTLQPIEAPAGDFTVAVRAARVLSSSGSIVPTLRDGTTTVATASTITLTESPTDYIVTFPAAAISGVPAAKWQAGSLVVRLAATAA